MKKLSVFIFVALFLVSFLFCSHTLLAADSIVGGLEGNIEKIQDTTNTLSDSDLRKDYLKQEWTKMLNNTAGGKYINQVDKILNYSSPIFEKVLGIPYSLSWVFVLSVIIFVVLLIYAGRISSFFEPFFLSYRGYAGPFIFLIIFFILLFSKIPKYLSLVIINFISNEGSWQAQLISILIVIFIFILLGYYSKYSQNLFSSLNEKRRILVLEQQREKDLMDKLEEKVKRINNEGLMD